MNRVAFTLAVFLTLSAAAGPADEVRDAEIAFAKAFADRDQAKFFSFVLDDATFFGGLRTLHGKPEVVERWSRFFKGAQAPFSWTPERVAVNAAGTVGLSSGPVVDPDGRLIGIYGSVWLKQPDGSWKILFDGPGGSPACLPEVAAPASEGDIAMADGATIHYRKVGDGPIPLIVPLGFLLEQDFKQLGDLATIIFYDPRNRGRSSHVEAVDTLSIQQDVKDLEAIRAHFKLDKFVPVGFSYLGLMVAMYASEHPEHVSRIVQLGPVPRKFGTEYAKELTHGNADVGASAEAVSKWQELRANPAAAKSQREACDVQEAVMRYVLVGNPTSAARVRSSCELENEWPANLDRHFQHHFASIQKLDWPASNLAKITMPVLTIHGTFDRNAPYGSGREWAASLPDARLVTIEGGGHASWADDPTNVFGAIRQFLRGEWPLLAEKVTKGNR
ncbi:MAG: alpha/beta fold hydrolase [Thermoanaerobaculia bacterium]